MTLGGRVIVNHGISTTAASSMHQPSSSYRTQVIPDFTVTSRNHIFRTVLDFRKHNVFISNEMDSFKFLGSWIFSSHATDHTRGRDENVIFVW